MVSVACSVTDTALSALSPPSSHRLNRGRQGRARGRGQGSGKYSRGHRGGRAGQAEVRLKPGGPHGTDLSHCASSPAPAFCGRERSLTPITAPSAISAGEPLALPATTTRFVVRRHFSCYSGQTVPTFGARLAQAGSSRSLPLFPSSGPPPFPLLTRARGARMGSPCSALAGARFCARDRSR